MALPSAGGTHHPGQVGPNEVTGDAIRDAQILKVSKLISITEADDLSARFPEEILSRVTIELQDGSRFTSPVTQAKGDPATAMSQAEFRAKFDLLAGVNLPQARRDAICTAIDSLSEAESCSELFELLMH
ncbi:hypothetical protein [Aliamphritea spongicola]|nr:hypothetical protein [Aliamphritea spongicola]